MKRRRDAVSCFQVMHSHTRNEGVYISHVAASDVLRLCEQLCISVFVVYLYAYMFGCLGFSWTVCRGVRTVTIAAISSVAGGALAAEGLSLQWDTLGRGVTVMTARVARVDQLRPGGLHCG